MHVCMDVCTCVCIYVCTYIYIGMIMDAGACVCFCICSRKYARVCHVHACMCLYGFVHRCVYAIACIRHFCMRILSLRKGSGS